MTLSASPCRSRRYAIAAGLADDLRAERVDVELRRLLRIVGLQMHVIEFQCHGAPPHIVGCSDRASGTCHRDRRWPGERRNAAVVVGDIPAAGSPSTVDVAARIEQEASDVKHCDRDDPGIFGQWPAQTGH